MLGEKHQIDEKQNAWCSYNMGFQAYDGYDNASQFRQGKRVALIWSAFIAALLLFGRLLSWWSQNYFKRTILNDVYLMIPF